MYNDSIIVLKRRMKKWTCKNGSEIPQQFAGFICDINSHNIKIVLLSYIKNAKCTLSKDLAGQYCVYYVKLFHDY